MGNCQKRHFGWLYQNGICAKPHSSVRQGAKIELRDGPSDTEPITWVEAAGILVSRHVYFLGATWKDLRRQGFIYGTKVTLNGRDYLCRSLQLRPSHPDRPSEWEGILDVTGKDITWAKGLYPFYGQDFIPGNGMREPDQCMVVGRHGPGLVTEQSVGSSVSSPGLRPILEPIGPEPVLDESLISHPVSVFCGSDRIDGELADFSDYDLIIRNRTNKDAPPIIHPGINEEEGDLIVIDRQAVQHISLS